MYAPDEFESGLPYKIGGWLAVDPAKSLPPGIFGATAISAQLAISVASKKVPVMVAVQAWVTGTLQL
ncbi:MAG: hypothetical protein AAB612_00980 [Patescibacteria group bacterium]